VLKSPYNRAFLIFRCDPITGRNRERDFKGTGSRARPEQTKTLCSRSTARKPLQAEARGGCLPERCASFPRLFRHNYRLEELGVFR
jgi:hypothetical protein